MKLIQTFLKPAITLSGVLAVFLLLFLFIHLDIGLKRFFDVDEFAYLHWTAKFVSGERPYIDFFMFIPFGFLTFMAPIFLFFSGTNIFYAGRVAAFILFVALVAVTSVLYAQTRSKRWMILPGVLLAFLPMPFDKFLEIRPDTLATVLSMLALLFQVRAIRAVGIKNKNWLIAGIFYGLSLLVLPKSLPAVGIGVVILLIYVVQNKAVWALRDAVVGCIAPFMLFLLWVATYGDFSRVLYSLTLMPIEANKLYEYFIMEPHLFFFPSAVAYGSESIGPGLLTNHLIWTLGLCMVVYQFFTPYLRADGDKKRALVEMLITWTAMMHIFFYVQASPVKHSQYLIPVAVFTAYFSADAIRIFSEKLSKRTGEWSGVIVVSVIGIALYWGITSALPSRYASTNAYQFDVLAKLTNTIPKDASVLDLDGRLIFWNDPYYICCLSIGQITGNLSRPPESLAAVLEAKKVPYIYEGDTNRVRYLSGADQYYIQTHYQPLPGWNGQLLKRK